MGKNRMEAFSDGVLAIIITIMVLELKIPHGDTLEALRPLIPVMFSYLLSFIYIGIYWNNHHHLLHTVKRVNGTVLWANLHLLFWLSLLPFVTGWMGENHFAAVPTALYGLVLMMSGSAYFLLSKAIIASHGQDSLLAKAVGSDWKTLFSVASYLVGIPLSFVANYLAGACYVGVALVWLIPDRRIEKVVGDQG